MRLPHINFSDHPAYRGLEESLSEADRNDSRARREFQLEHTRKNWEPYRPFWNYPDDGPLAGRPRLLGDFHRDGVVGVRLGPLLGKLRTVAESYLDGIRQTRAAANPGTPRNANTRLTLDDLRTSENRSLINLIQEILEGYEIVELVGRYLGARQIVLPSAHFKINEQSQAENNGVRNVFGELGAPDPPMNGMHVDVTVFQVKAIIYLSEVDGPEHGAFHYVLGSNQAPQVPFDEFLQRMATGVFVPERGLPNRRVLMALHPGERQRLDFGADLAFDSEIGMELLEREAMFTSRQADMVLFDPRGVHRGGHVTAGERSILQLTLTGVLPPQA